MLGADAVFALRGAALVAMRRGILRRGSAAKPVARRQMGKTCGCAGIAQMVEQSLRKRWVGGSSPSTGTIILHVQPGDMGDTLVANGLSMVCKVLCPKSIYPGSWCMKLIGQIPSSTCLMPILRPASTVETLIVLRAMRMRPHAVTGCRGRGRGTPRPAGPYKALRQGHRVRPGSSYRAPRVAVPR